MDIWNMIDSVEEAVFAFEVNKIGHNFGQLVEQLVPLMSGLDETRLLEVNQVLTAMLGAMENKDYLYLADLLHFELRPFLNRVLS